MRYPVFFTCVFTLIISFHASTALMAQELPPVRRHAFEMSYGFYPVLHFSSKSNGAGAWGSSWDRERYRSIGAINMGYSLEVSKHLQIGMACSYLNIREEYSPRGAGATFDYRLERTRSWAIMPKVSYKWYDRKDGQVYSSLLIGVDVREETIKEDARQDLNEKKELKELAYQVTLVGAKVGNRKGVFVEWGFGYSGLFIGGAFLKL